MSVFRCEAARSTATGGTEVFEGSLHIGDKGSSEAWLAEWWTKMRDAERQSWTDRGKKSLPCRFTGFGKLESQIIFRGILVGMIAPNASTI